MLGILAASLSGLRIYVVWVKGLENCFEEGESARRVRFHAGVKDIYIAMNSVISSLSSIITDVLITIPELLIIKNAQLN